MILTNQPMILQRMINKLTYYCNKWRMEIKQTKFDILIFRNAGKSSANEQKSSELMQIHCDRTTPKLTFTKHDTKNK